MKVEAAKTVLGDECRLIAENSVLEYRGKEYPYIHLCYEEKETGERFTTTELDEMNLSQIYNLYRAEKGIPFAEKLN